MARRSRNRESRAESRREEAAIKLLVLGGAFVLGPLFFRNSMFGKALIAAPGLAQGADISWKYTVASGTMGGGKFTRLGTAVLSTGETAEVRNEGIDGPSDEKGRPTVTVDSVMRFKDGSSITMRYAGYRDLTLPLESVSHSWAHALACRG